ncbi:MAG: hypothetical protein GX324_10985, partial [Aeromonadales bacterium]|nr:hypothetical protein [Aeromonadales bacterium]
MAKKGFFSWLGFGKNKQQPEADEEQKIASDSEVEAGAVEVERSLTDK